MAKKKWTPIYTKAGKRIGTYSYKTKHYHLKSDRYARKAWYIKTKTGKLKLKSRGLN